jgi:hypothetical protein
MKINVTSGHLLQEGRDIKTNWPTDRQSTSTSTSTSEKREHSLRSDGNVWLLVLSDLIRHRLHCKLQTRPLVRDGALQDEQQSNFQKKGKDKMWTWA